MYLYGDKTINVDSRFKLKGKCRSEKWEVYLYGDKTIKVDFRFKLKGKCRSEKWEVYLYGDTLHQGGLPVQVEGQVSQ